MLAGCQDPGPVNERRKIKLMYFMEGRIGRDTPPPITHPENFYGFGIAVAVLYAQGRVAGMVLGFASVDFLLGGLFLEAFRRTGANAPAQR
jgi:hypothetical protein